MNRRGFTFIEIIAALAVVSIALIALLRLHLISIGMSSRSEATAEAVLLAQSLIEESLAEGFPQVGSSSDTVMQGSRELNWKRQVAEMKPAGLAETDITPMRSIAVEVSWQEGRRRARINLSTCVAEGNGGRI